MDSIITLSVIGALVMYIVSMVSLFALRRRQPGMQRPFTVPFYPYFPAVALILSTVALAAIAWYYSWLTIWFFVGLLVCLGVFFAAGKHKQKLDDAVLQATKPMP